MRDGSQLAGHGSCDDRGAAVSCGGLSGPFWVRFGGRGTGFLSWPKVKKVAGWNFAAMHRRRHRERRHHLCNGVGGVAAPAWLIAPRLATSKKRRREIEEGVKFAKMHKKLKHTKN